MKQENQNYINLETLAGGAFAEKINAAIAEVAENIQNPNTEATAKRGITINIKFSPDKRRQLATAMISVATKLAPTEAIDTSIIMGKNLRTGKVEYAEYDGQIIGQTTFDNMGESFDPDTGEIFDNPDSGITPLRAIK